MKILVGIFVSLFITAIVASGKAIVDVAVLQSESKNMHSLLLDTNKKIIIIQKDIKTILRKL